VNSNLLLAILSMDAYNRGGGSASRGLVVDADVVGGATVDISKTDNLTGFFAQAYDLNGQKIISYRGTDDAHDRVSGWPVGGGAYTAPQALEAAQFYQLVVGGGSTSNLTLNQLYSANVWLTGHSLGGGLAGLIASVYGQHATVFDSMAFSLAASSLYVDMTTPLLNGHVGEAQYYLGSQPNPISASGIRSLQVEGQSLDTVGGDYRAGSHDAEIQQRRCGRGRHAGIVRHSRNGCNGQGDTVIPNGFGCPELPNQRVMLEWIIDSLGAILRVPGYWSTMP
jgi:hypothetical protein